MTCLSDAYNAFTGTQNPVFTSYRPQTFLIMWSIIVEDRTAFYCPGVRPDVRLLFWDKRLKIVYMHKHWNVAYNWYKRLILIRCIKSHMTICKSPCKRILYWVRILMHSTLQWLLHKLFIICMVARANSFRFGLFSSVDDALSTYWKCRTPAPIHEIKNDNLRVKIFNTDISGHVYLFLYD